MANPLDKIKKIKGKSRTELRTRVQQTLSAYGEQLGFSRNWLTDEEFLNLLDKSQFDTKEVSAEQLFEKFYRNADAKFFQSFAHKTATIEIFKREFGAPSIEFFIERAERLVEGKFDLLGFENLDFGAAVDWHFEPISGKHSPLKHWKQFDELDTEETGDKKIIWELNRQQHFFALGVAFWLTGEERYAATFARHLDSWIEQNPAGAGVNWASSLEVSLRAISWIWAFQFFKNSNSFTPGLFRKALKMLVLHARHIEKYLSTYFNPNTHLTGEALGLYYLGTQLPFFERAADWRKTGEEILLRELDRQILPDGVYFEQSTWYQRYTTDFYTQFLILKKLNDARKDLPAKLVEKLQSSLDFLMNITRPDGTTPLVGDDDGGRTLPRSDALPDDFRAELSTGASLFKRGDYKFVAENFAQETLWLLGAESIEAFENLEADAPQKTSAAFASGGYFVMRDGWTETDNYLLVDCGNLGANGSAGHGHADALAIDLSVGGKRLLVDAGTYSYHESEDARNRFRSTEAHNTLTIDGKSQSEPGGKFGWQTKANAKLNEWISQERFDFFEGAHDGYERFETAGAAAHTRSVLFLKNDYWIMRDFCETRGAHRYALNFQFDAATNPAIERAENGLLCITEKSEQNVGARLFTFGDNGDWRSERGEISPVFGKKIDAPFLKFVSEGVGSQEFFTFLLPSEKDFAAPEVFETEVEGARAFVISYRHYTDVFVFSDGAQIVRTEFFNTDFRFFWARLSAGETLPEEFVLVGGTHFSIGAKSIINHEQPIEFATARRFGDELNVRTPESLFSVSLTQKKQRKKKKKPVTYVLKNPA